MDARPTLHMIANAHIDPVWLWDWREGMNEGIQTCKTVLDLMDENPELTFTRGESAIYEHIEKYAPETFERIKEAVVKGSWEVVGGTYVQCDNLLPDSECVLRQFAAGQRYFAERFGKTASTAWSADSFGHSACLPRIFEAAGIDSFSFMRGTPLADAEDKHDVFWWEGPEGYRVLACKAKPYCSERKGVAAFMDKALKRAKEGPLRNVAVFYGLGNHGGNPTRALQAEAKKWALEHPKAKVVFSGLGSFFAAAREELRCGNAELPVFSGEVGLPKPRGGYSTMMRFKFAFRKAQARLLRAERSSSAIEAALGRKSPSLDGAWKDLLFNSFHDILPGTSIERAMDEQLSWLGGVDLAAQRAEGDSLLALASEIDTAVKAAEGDRPSGVPLLVFNPFHYPFKGHVELETCMDYREVPARSTVHILDPKRRELPQQVIKKEGNYGDNFRKRLLAPVELPPFGWSVLEYVCDTDGGAPLSVESDLKACEAEFSIENEFYRVEARPGDDGVSISHNGEKLFNGKKLSAGLFGDDWGAWGKTDESNSDGLLKELWKTTQTRILERGPERVSLWTQFAGGRSRLDLTFSLCRGREAVDVAARLFWDERQLRLKLIMPFGNSALFETPGGAVERKPCGVVPGCRWVRVMEGTKTFGFASDGLTDFDLADGSFHATLVRASGYTQWRRCPGWEEPWVPVSDSGSYQFKFLLQPGDSELPRLAEELEQAPLATLVPAKPGRLPRQGSLMSLTPPSIRLLALKPAFDGDGFILRLQSGEDARPRLVWLGESFELGELPAGKILSWRIARRAGEWKASLSNLMETGAANAPGQPVPQPSA